ncbi:MAG: hypothetical protein BWX86_01008 [Verrucomicrobia bacterium ADurb.Bin122]|nr:MAG: hypothetical protein BWX86_01008 [Verrucomicrobia bacterium ADurb.Bin122]
MAHATHPHDRAAQGCEGFVDWQMRTQLPRRRAQAQMCPRRLKCDLLQKAHDLDPLAVIDASQCLLQGDLTRGRQHHLSDRRPAGILDHRRVRAHGRITLDVHTRPRRWALSLLQVPHDANATTGILDEHRRRGRMGERHHARQPHRIALGDLIRPQRAHLLGQAQLRRLVEQQGAIALTLELKQSFLEHPCRTIGNGEPDRLHPRTNVQGPRLPRLQHHLSRIVTQRQCDSRLPRMHHAHHLDPLSGRQPRDLLARCRSLTESRILLRPPHHLDRRRRGHPDFRISKFSARSPLPHIHTGHPDHRPLTRWHRLPPIGQHLATRHAPIHDNIHLHMGDIRLPLRIHQPLHRHESQVKSPHVAQLPTCRQGSYRLRLRQYSHLDRVAADPPRRYYDPFHLHTLPRPHRQGRLATRNKKADPIGLAPEKPPMRVVIIDPHRQLHWHRLLAPGIMQMPKLRDLRNQRRSLRARPFGAKPSAAGEAHQRPRDTPQPTHLRGHAANGIKKGAHEE